MTAQRTPGAWYTTLGPFDIGAGYIFGADNQPVAMVCDAESTPIPFDGGEHWERARFIVTACNAYDTLLSENARLKSDNVRLVCEITNLKSETFALVRDMTAIEALEEIIRNVDLWKTSDNMAGRIYGIASAALAGKDGGE